MARTSNGQCVLHPQLARAVVAACRLDQERVSAGARELRDLLLDAREHPALPMRSEPVDRGR